MHDLLAYRETFRSALEISRTEDPFDREERIVTPLSSPEEAGPGGRPGTSQTSTMPVLAAILIDDEPPFDWARDVPFDWAGDVPEPWARDPRPPRSNPSSPVDEDQTMTEQPETRRAGSLRPRRTDSRLERVEILERFRDAVEPAPPPRAEPAAAKRTAPHRITTKTAPRRAVTKEKATTHLTNKKVAKRAKVKKMTAKKTAKKATAKKKTAKRAVAIKVTTRTGKPARKESAGKKATAKKTAKQGR
ncbi:MAG TPA: hypothetical protein VIX84_15490 [Acidimicrobiales bacterium]